MFTSFLRTHINKVRTIQDKIYRIQTIDWSMKDNLKAKGRMANMYL